MPTIGAGGVLGISMESSRGTYVAPSKWVPIRSESLTTSQELTYRRNIRGIADPMLPLPGNLTHEGDIEFECTPDVLPYIFKSMRVGVTKTGSSDPYTYVYLPTHTATSTASMSIYIERGGIRFTYSGVTIGKLSLTINEGIMICTASVSALSEVTQSATSSSYSNNKPFSTGNFSIEIPNSSAVTDMDNITFDIDEGIQTNHRLNGSQNPASVTLGERTVTCSMDRDFSSRADFDAFKAATATSLAVICTYTPSGGSANDRYLKLEMPVASMESYTVNLGSQGDLVRASTTYTASYSNSDTFAYRATVKTDENLA